MRVNVDEARCDDESVDVHDTGRGLGDRRSDSDDGVAFDGDISAVPGAGCAVHDAAAAQHEIVSRRLRHENRRGEEEREDGCPHADNIALS